MLFSSIPKIILLSLVASCLGPACTDQQPNTRVTQTPTQVDFEKDKSQLLEVINGETKAAFNRDYEAWKDHWVHEEYVTKTYIDFSKNTMTETRGWKEIDTFVKTYIEQHPEPDPLPTLVDDINVRIYGTGAQVDYEQNDGDRGLKRESRLMEKVDGKWKIAGMHTTIYGSK